MLSRPFTLFAAATLKARLESVRGVTAVSELLRRCIGGERAAATVPELLCSCMDRERFMTADAELLCS